MMPKKTGKGCLSVIDLVQATSDLVNPRPHYTHPANAQDTSYSDQTSLQLNTMCASSFADELLMVKPAEQPDKFA